MYPQLNSTWGNMPNLFDIKLEVKKLHDAGKIHNWEQCFTHLEMNHLNLMTEFEFNVMREAIYEWYESELV